MQSSCACSPFICSLHSYHHTYCSVLLHSLSFFLLLIRCYSFAICILPVSHTLSTSIFLFYMYCETFWSVGLVRKCVQATNHFCRKCKIAIKNEFARIDVIVATGFQMKWEEGEREKSARERDTRQRIEEKERLKIRRMKARTVITSHCPMVSLANRTELSSAQP